MCGIVGILSKSGSLSNDQFDIFEELLYADALRGMDSTGMFVVDGKNNIDVMKQAVGPELFLKMDSWKKLRSKFTGKGRILVGHNRKATVGNIVTKNAHPFVDKKIVLVHNGYIANHQDLDKTKEVDSETIITALKSETDYLKGLEKLFGAFAICWYDHEKRKLFITRNSDRTLYFCHTQQSFLIASEEDMLTWILKRNNIMFESPVLLMAGKVMEISLSPFTIVGADIPKSTPIHTGSARAVERHYSEHTAIDPYETSASGSPVMEGPVKPDTDIEQTVATLMKLYKQGKRVYFQPTGFQAFIDRTQVVGYCWCAGSYPAKAVWSYNKKDDERELEHHDVDENGPLIATCMAVQRQDRQVSVILGNVREPHGHVKDWENQAVLPEEWKDIRDTEYCVECGGCHFKAQDLDYTKINRKDGVYNVICAECVERSYNGSKEKKTVKEITELDRAREVGAQLAAAAAFEKKPPEVAGENGG